VIDTHFARVLRDTFSSPNEESIIEDAAIESHRLFGPGPAPLAERVQRWLEAMSANWSEALPREDWAAPLFYDIIPATSGTYIQRLAPDAA
jgi:hypothetical protein